MASDHWTAPCRAPCSQLVPCRAVQCSAPCATAFDKHHQQLIAIKSLHHTHDSHADITCYLLHHLTSSLLLAMTLDLLLRWLPRVSQRRRHQWTHANAFINATA